MDHRRYVSKKEEQCGERKKPIFERKKEKTRDSTGLFFIKISTNKQNFFEDVFSF